jgi:hypothetical protein
MRLRAGVLAIALGIVTSATARADTVGVIALAPAHGPLARADLARALEVAAAGTGDRALVDPISTADHAIAAGAVPAGELARFRRVAEVAAEGWRAYLRVAADFAAERLSAARRDAEDLLAFDGGAELYADVSLRLGAVLDQLGQKAEAGEAFRLAAALDPSRAVTTAEFSPDVVAAFDAARAAQVPAAAVTIRSDAGAQIEIDGRAAGAAPVEAQLAVGTHVAVARAPGHRARGVAFAVTAEGAQIDLALDPDGAPTAIDVGTGADPAAASVDAALVYGEVDGVVLAAVVAREGGTALLGQWCAGAPVRCTPVVEVAYRGPELGAAATRMWTTLRDARASARYQPSLPVDPRLTSGGGGDGGRCRLCRNPWVWAGVGALLVGAGVTTAVVAGSGTKQPVVTVDPGAFTKF